MEDRAIDVVAENIDLALFWGTLRDSTLVARKLAQAVRVVVVSPVYLARRGVPSAPGICSSTTRSLRPELWRRRMAIPARTSESSVRIQRWLTVNAAKGVRAAVIAGQGFAISARWMFAPELASGEVVPVLDDWTLPPIDLWVIFPSGRLTSAKARLFVKWFEKTISSWQVSNPSLKAA